MPLLRIMAMDESPTVLRPKTGNEPYRLGVRPRKPAKPKHRFDVSAVNDEDRIDPGRGEGLSCSARSTDQLIHNFYRPLKAIERVWEIDSAPLPEGSSRDIDPRVTIRITGKSSLLVS